MVLKQLVVFADSDVSLRLETVADQTAISSNTVSPAPLRIRRSTIRNKSSKSFGKKSTPTRIDLCKNELQELLRQNLDQLPEDVHSIYQLSCYLLPRLKECGYSGSERTLRNYLHTNPSVKAIFEKGISTHDQDQKLE